MPVSKYSLIFQLLIQQQLIRKQQTGLKMSETGICTFSLQATQALHWCCALSPLLPMAALPGPTTPSTFLVGTWHKWWKTNHREEVKQLTTQCYNNNLFINGKKAKQLVDEFKKGCRVKVLLIMNKVYQRVDSTKLVSGHIMIIIQWSELASQPHVLRWSSKTCTSCRS